MKSYSFITASLLALAKADLGSDASAVISQATGLASLVKGWDKGKGLSGALEIQQSYEPLSKAVGSLANSVNDIEVNSENVKTLTDLISGITTLLENLTEKASDFSSVGAEKIVQGDITELAAPAGEIVSKVYEKGKSNCSAVDALKDPLSSLKAGLDSAGFAYSASIPSFPDIKCEGSSNSEIASSSKSEEKTSAPTSSKSEETASASKSVSETKPSSTVATANGASVIGSGVSALAVLLL